MDRKAIIKEKLQGIESYNPGHIPTLEEHLTWQITNNEYDFEANLALLRLYQFNPERFNAECAKLVLLKAIVSMNHWDFTLCKYLIHLEHLSKEPLLHVVQLGFLLETCRFTEFWMKVKENPKLVSAISGFRESVCKFIVQIISQTYQRISKILLMNFLDIQENELIQFCKKYQWSETIDENNVQLILVNNHEENIKSVKIRERVNFDSITSMSEAFRPSKSDFFIKTTYNVNK
ncbi:Eukaryotic translation initiation factor 3 subunit K [Schistosoma japonicum]|nr:Eukaryotic translation initiation factor 3 subunit K [Schistosoma japonicum]